MCCSYIEGVEKKEKKYSLNLGLLSPHCPLEKVKQSTFLVVPSQGTGQGRVQRQIPPIPLRKWVCTENSPITVV